MVDLIRQANINRLDEANNIGGGSMLYSELPLGSSKLSKISGVRTFTLNGDTPVFVTDDRCNTQTLMFPTLKTAIGTVGNQPHLSLPPTLTGFTVVGDAGDTSTYNYRLL
jgi:hypothetical protein